MQKAELLVKYSLAKKKISSLLLNVREFRYIKSFGLFEDNGKKTETLEFNV